MLRRTSLHRVPITSWPSTPRRSLRAPISLAKLIFTAWKAFGSVFDHFSGAKRDELRRDAERLIQIRDFLA